jgi:hypothetical protein
MGRTVCLQVAVLKHNQGSLSLYSLTGCYCSVFVKFLLLLAMHAYRAAA